MSYSINDLTQYDYFKDKDSSYLLDSLTGAISRIHIIGYIKSLMKDNIPFSLHIIDIDNFKSINDELGHQAGDKILKDTVNALIEISLNDSLVGRYGGDEFLVITKNLTEYNDIWKYSKIIFEYIRNKNIPGGIASNLTITSGVATFPKDSKDYEELFLKIDKALYRGKQKGRNCFIIYNDKMHKDIDVLNEALQMGEMMDYIYDIIMQNIAIDYKIKKICGYLNELFDISAYYISKKCKIATLYDEEDKTLSVLKQDYIKKVMGSKDLLAINNYSKLKEKYPEFHKYCWNNKIKSFVIVKLYAFDKDFGYILFTSYNIKRIWQENECVLFSYLTRLLSLLFYYNKIEERLISD